MASSRISCSCGGQWGMEGQGHATFYSAKPGSKSRAHHFLTAMLAWWRCKVFKELRLASALCCLLHDARPIMHSHLCMFLAVIIQQWENAANDEGQFAGMKRSCIHVDGVELFLPAGLDSRGRVTSGCQVRGESRTCRLLPRTPVSRRASPQGPPEAVASKGQCLRGGGDGGRGTAALAACDLRVGDSLPGTG